MVNHCLRLRLRWRRPLRLAAAHVGVRRDLVLLTLVVVALVSRKFQMSPQVSQVSRMMEVVPKVGEGGLRVVGGVGRQVRRRAPGHHLVGSRMGRCGGGG